MDLKLIEHVRNIISLLYEQNTGWNSHIWNFFSEKKINFGLYFAENQIFRSTMLYYVIVSSYVCRFSWFWYQWKEETLPYTMVPNNYTLGVSSLNSWEGGNKKGSGRRGLKERFVI